MNEQEMMLRKIRSLDFAMWEMRIFLDTHPNDPAAIKKYDSYAMKHKEMINIYTSKYGPIISPGSMGSMKWTWLADPWPWDYTGEGK